MEYKVLTIRIPKEMHDALRKRAFFAKTSMNQDVIDALRSHLEKEAESEKASAYL